MTFGEPPGTDPPTPPLSAPDAHGAPIQLVDAAHPSAAQRVESAEFGQRPVKFVQIHIVQVFNPQRTGLTFVVEFQPDGGAKFKLGLFSLYPADHPGTFIVATRNLVHSPGSVIVTLRTDALDTAMSPRVGVGRIALIDSE